MQKENEPAKLVINGLLFDGARVSDVINPSTGEVFASCGRASVEQVERAVASAKDAFPAWSKTSVVERSAVLSAMADRIEAHADELAQLLSREGGCPISDTPYEIAGLIAGMRYFSSLQMEAQVLEDSAERRARVFYRPLGVVAAICPWNFPIDVLSAKLSPALMAGNTVVVKPAGTTPLTTLRIASMVRDLLPPGVLNVIADDNDMGDVLTGHPDVHKITFTGSTITGKRVYRSAVDHLKRLTLELGGNDVAIVLDDARVADIADSIFRGGFLHNGQNCVGIKRIYAHETVYRDLCDALISRCEASVVGDSLNPEVTHGPLQNASHFEKAKIVLADAQANGLIACGGHVIDRPGYFMEPTLVTDIFEGSKLVDEEQFCPVVPIMKFKNDAEVVERANRSPYGLGSSVWSADNARAFAIAEQLETGMVWVNKYADIVHHLPFNGAKQSGFGVEYGEDGLREFTQLQLINEVP